MNRLPVIIFWTIPGLVGLLLLVRALPRYTRLTRDLPTARRALGRTPTPRRRRTAG